LTWLHRRRSSIHRLFVWLIKSRVLIFSGPILDQKLQQSVQTNCSIAIKLQLSLEHNTYICIDTHTQNKGLYIILGQWLGIEPCSFCWFRNYMVDLWE
jgi:hypothetical protein